MLSGHTQNSRTEVWLCATATESFGRHGDRVAVKVLDSHRLARDEVRKLLLLREVPNVAQLLGAVEVTVGDATRPGLVFPFYDSSGTHNTLFSSREWCC